MTKAAGIKQAFEDAAPYLRDFQAALTKGALVICAQCSRFAFAGEPNQPGQCRQHHVEAFPFVPFRCAEFERRQKKAA